MQQSHSIRRCSGSEVTVQSSSENVYFESYSSALIVHYSINISRPDWNSVNNRFLISYSPIALCSRTFNATTGYIVSPSYPSNYPDNSLCFFHLRFPSSRDGTIFKGTVLNFESFSIEGTVSNAQRYQTNISCSYDFLEVCFYELAVL